MSRLLPGTFIVEKILDKRIKGSKIEYLVKWEGYSEADNTWEPIKNLENVVYLINEYESLNPNPNKNQMKLSNKVNDKLRKHHNLQLYYIY